MHLWAQTFTVADNITQQLDVIASNSIDLLPGFYSGSNFHAKIDNDLCSGHAPTKHISQESDSISKETIMGNRTLTNSFSFNVFPVPAINSATISFYLPSQSNVLITIDDVLGHQIINVINTHDLSSGNHQQIINVSSLSPGVYICVIKAGDHIQQRKLIIE